MMVLMDDNVGIEHRLVDEMDPTKIISIEKKNLRSKNNKTHTCGFGFNGGKNFDNVDNV